MLQGLKHFFVKWVVGIVLALNEYDEFECCMIQDANIVQNWHLEMPSSFWSKLVSTEGYRIGPGNLSYYLLEMFGWGPFRDMRFIQNL